MTQPRGDPLHVAIVGAGPAGSAAALALREGGARVTLIDRHSFPRDKLCAGVVDARGYQELRAFGLGDEVRPFERVELHASERAASIDRPSLDVAGGVISRRLLDDKLARRAERSGAKLLEGALVSGATRREDGIELHVEGRDPVRADVVIAADGAPSAVARALGVQGPTTSGVGLRALAQEVRLPAGLWLVVHERIAPGIGYVVSHGDGAASLGVLLRHDDSGDARRDPRALVGRLFGLRVVSGLLSGARVGEARAHSLPSAWLPGPFVGDRALFVGDAASLAGPLPGGVGHALRSGALAAQAILRAAPKGRFSARALSSYSRSLRGELLADLEVRHRLARDLESVSAARRVTRVLARSPRLQRAFLAALAGPRPRLPIRWDFARFLGT